MQIFSSSQGSKVDLNDAFLEADTGSSLDL
jgi:hypothetical protein